jgi:hypothetical protein
VVEPVEKYIKLCERDTTVLCLYNAGGDVFLQIVKLINDDGWCGEPGRYKLTGEERGQERGSIKC